MFGIWSGFQDLYYTTANLKINIGLFYGFYAGSLLKYVTFILIENCVLFVGVFNHPIWMLTADIVTFAGSTAWHKGKICESSRNIHDMQVFKIKIGHFCTAK